MAHGVFVNAVVDYLLQQDVNPVIRVLAIAQFADVHAWTHPDVLLPIKAPNVVFCVRDLLCHMVPEIREVVRV